MAAPADVDHVLARLDTPSPDETVRPGTLPKMMAGPGGGAQAGVVFDMLLTEIRGIKKMQEQILALLQGRPGSTGGGDGPHHEDDAPAAAPPRNAGSRTVLVVDDDARARQEVEAALSNYRQAVIRRDALRDAGAQAEIAARIARARQREGDIKGMAALITDEILDHYYVEAGWDDLPDALVARYGDLAPSVRLMSYTAINQYQKDPAILDRWGEVAGRIRDLTS